MQLFGDRILIRKATKNDAAFIFRLLNQASFKDNIADKKITDLHDAEMYIETAFLALYRESLFSPYVVCLREEPFTQIGVCGLYKRPSLHYPDLGYAYLDEYTGLGYASEAARSVINFAKKEFRLKYICALTNPTNQSSINLLINCGFNLETQILLNLEQGVSNLYLQRLS